VAGLPKLREETDPSGERTAPGPIDRRMGRRDFLRRGLMGTAGVVLSGLLAGRSVELAEAAAPSVSLGAFAPSLPWGF
jgi:hypothetical protein